MSFGWSPYVPVAKRLRDAKKEMGKLRNKGRLIQPIEIKGRKIATTFWGNAWCTHLENFSDYSNRLPRGRTYVRNGSVCHLEIQKGLITAMVIGSEIYNIKIRIKPLSKNLWQAVQYKCAGEIGSMLELLQGKLSNNVMQAITDPKSGLFPQPDEIDLNCDCPDWAIMCKHVAAVLYGIGARLDYSPELLFLLRDVDHMDLIESEMRIPQNTRKTPQVTGDLSAIFGIDLEEESMPVKKATKPDTAKPKIAITKINISRGIRASHIKKLRKKFAMSEAEFAKLLGKPVITIRNWEAKKGVLKLRSASRLVLETAFAMDKKNARKLYEAHENAH